MGQPIPQDVGLLLSQASLAINQHTTSVGQDIIKHSAAHFNTVEQMLGQVIRRQEGKCTPEDMAGLTATQLREVNRESIMNLTKANRDLGPCAAAENAEARRAAKEGKPKREPRPPKSKAVVAEEASEEAPAEAPEAPAVFHALEVPFSLTQFPMAVQVTEGIWFVPQMLQAMDIDPDAILQLLLSLPVQSDSQDIQCDFMNPLVIQGTNSALKMRGHDLPREKTWLQTQPEKGLLRYGYSGWQYLISRAVKDIVCMPAINEVLVKSNALAAIPPFNTCIGTIYRKGSDCIGEHNDKAKDLVPESWIGLFRLGPPRAFHILDKGAILWNENVGHGSAVWMNLAANSKYKHVLPRMSESCPVSASLAFRSVATLMDWAKVDKEIEKAEKKKMPKQGQTVEAAPVQEAAPMQEAPMQAAPVEAAPMEAAPVQAAPSRPKGYIGSMMAFVKPAQK